MAKCKYCGKEIDPNTQVCPYCNKANPLYIPVQEGGLSNSKKRRVKGVILQDQPPLDKISGMAIAGFVTSFFFPLIGLPFSITALDRAKGDNYLTNQRYAKAGIIISVIMIILWIIMIPVLIVSI